MFNSQHPQAHDICPYNSAHQILKYRMAKHLVKCRKSYHGESAMTVCLFNSNHSIPEAEKRYHMENCPDRFNLDKQILVDKDVDPTKFPVQSMEVNNDEDWDEESCPSYQPDDYCKKNAILRQAKVESASIRKNFRVEERQRIQKLKEMGPSNVDNEFQNKFRSAALANTTTNVQEESPFTVQDLQRILQSGAPKPIIIDPNYKPIFVRSNDTTAEEREKRPEETTELAEACEVVNNNHTETPPSPDSDSKEKADGFIKQTYRRKGGRGRGVGTSR